MTIELDQITAWIAQYIWAFTRLGGLMMVMVNIGTRNTPMRVRMALVLATTLVVAPVLPPGPDIALFSVNAFMVVAQQLLIGAAVGFASILFMQTFVVAGQMIAMQTSLGFASMVDPSNGQSTPVVGQFYMLLATLIFFAVDGHLKLIYLVAESFKTLPVSEKGLSLASYHALALWLSHLFSAALAMSLSSIVAMLTINLSFGVMTRSAPQLNIFSMGFAVSMIFGLFVLWMTISSFLGHYDLQWQESLKLICTILEGC